MRVLSLVVVLLMSAPAAGAAPVSPQDLEAFFAEFFATALRAREVPGAAVAVVHDGRLVFRGGYGYADLDQRRPMDPDRTVFRVASLTKLFTATAIAQLVEAGRLELNRDVNDYLGVDTIPSTGFGPVTVAHLLTHTAGFDQRNIGTAARRRGAVAPLRRYLRRHMPPRIYPPGEAISYSNHGYALLGLLVEGQTELPYPRYVTEHILAPLGMTRSGFASAAYPADALATSYARRGGRLVAYGDDYVRYPPAAGLRATASDMARFMIAHLEGGRIEGRAVLTKKATAAMQATQFTHHPRLPGMGHGFFEYDLDGRRAVGHTGDWRGFSSALLLFPDAGLGLFVAYNREERRLRETLMERFATRYIGPAKAPPPLTSTAPAPRGLSGRYRHRRLAQTTIDKLGALMGFAPERVVTVDDRGALFVDGERFRAIAPGLFRGEASGKRVAFRVDASGAGARLLEDQSAFDRLSMWETPAVQAAYVGVLALVLLSASLGWPVAALVTRFWRRRSTGPAHGRGWPRLAAGGVAGVILVFLVGVAACLATLDPADIGHRH